MKTSIGIFLIGFIVVCFVLIALMLVCKINYFISLKADRIIFFVNQFFYKKKPLFNENATVNGNLNKNLNKKLSNDLSDNSIKDIKDDEIPLNILTDIISQSVAMIFPDKKVKILSYGLIGGRKNNNEWSLSGKLEHFDSHRIR